MMCGMLPKVINIIVTNKALNFGEHVGFRKKVQALAKQKDCKLVGEWEKSMVNHLYWCVASTSNGDGEMVKAKWLSLDNHVHNKHVGHGELYPECSHGTLRGQDRNKKWLKRRKYNIALLANTVFSNHIFM